MSNIIRFDEFLLERVEFTNQTIGEIYKKYNKNPKLSVDAFRTYFKSDPDTQVDDETKLNDAIILKTGAYTNWFVFNTQYFTDIDKISYEIFVATVEADPTSIIKGDKIGRIGSYTKWMLHHYATTLKEVLGGQRRYTEDLYKITEAITKLITNKAKLEMNVELRPIEKDANGEPIKRIIKNPKDINSFKSFRDLLDFADTLDVQQSKTQAIKAAKIEGTDVLLDNEDYFIAIPKTYDAAKFYAANTRWCTSREQEFNQYSSQGHLFVIITREDNEKYQFHFQSSQFMDAQDEAIEFDEFLKEHPVVKDTIIRYAEAHVATDFKFVKALITLDEPIVVKQLLKDNLINSNDLDIFTICDIMKYAPKGWLQDRIVENKYAIRNGVVYMAFKDYTDEAFIYLFDDKYQNSAKTVLNNEHHDWEYNISFDMESAVDMLNKKNRKRIDDLIVNAKVMFYDEDEEEKVLITDDNIYYYNIGEILELEALEEVKSALETAYGYAYEDAYQSKVHKTYVEAIEDLFEGEFIRVMNQEELVIKQTVMWNNSKKEVTPLMMNLLMPVDPSALGEAVKINMEHHDGDYESLSLAELIIAALYHEEKQIDRGLSNDIYVSESDASESYNERVVDELPALKVTESLRFIKRFNDYKK
jgi:hypothetical protein